MNNRKERIIRVIPAVFCFAAIICAVTFAILGTKKVPFDVPINETQYFDADFDWEDENGEKVTLPYAPQTKAGQPFSISTNLPGNIEDNMDLFIRADQLDLNIYVDEELRFRYSTDETRFFGRLAPRRYIFVGLDACDAGNVLRIESICDVDSLGRFDVLMYGTRHDIEKQWITSNLSDVIVAGVMIIICFICLITAIVLSISNRTFFDIIHLAIMGILASIWILCNSEINQILLTNSSISLSLDYMMLLLLPFPFLLFMNATQKYKYNRVYMIFEYVAVANAVLCTVLQLFSIRDYSEVFPLIAGWFGCSLIMILITIAIDIFKEKDYSYIYVAIGIIAGVVATLVQIGLFVLGVFSFGGKSVAYALLIMLLTTVIHTYKKLKEAELQKQMAVAQGKAESRFLANMSHEIRTPINAVLGMNEMILRETTEGKVREYAENIDTSGRMLLSIVNDILDFSKIRSGSMKIIPVKYSLIKTIGELRDIIAPRAMAKSLLFSVEIDQKIPNNLLGDDVRVKQIVLNILTNAVKYTEKGKVVLKVTGEKTDDENMTLCITVTDTGKGIKEEDREALFSAFTRVDEKNNRNIEGTGLGLALVVQLINAMNGTIEVQSTYGSGSSFIVTLPQGIVDNQTVSEAAAEGEMKKPQSSHRKSALFKAPEAKILVVDDTLINLTVVKGLLQRTEISVTTANSGTICLDYLRNQTFDVVLLDHLMPVMDGEETLMHIKEEDLCPNTPVIMLTADAVEGSREKFLAMGFDDYLSKPVSPYELEDTLMKYIPEEKIIKLG